MMQTYKLSPIPTGEIIEGYNVDWALTDTPVVEMDQHTHAVVTIDDDLDTRSIAHLLRRLADRVEAGKATMTKPCR